MLSRDLLRETFGAARPYDVYVATGTPSQQESWRSFEAQAALTDAQRALLAGFVREVNVLVSSGVWCGDCVQQCPFLAHAERANPEKIRVRFVDRDEHAELAERVMISEGLRVPVAIFMNEDFDFVSLFGDRSLNRYRALAAKRLGASCPLPGAPVPPDEVASQRQDWVDEFERVQLLCRLSTKLRQRYGD